MARCACVLHQCLAQDAQRAELEIRVLRDLCGQESLLRIDKQLGRVDGMRRFTAHLDRGVDDVEPRTCDSREILLSRCLALQSSEVAIAALVPSYEQQYAAETMQHVMP